MDPVGQLSVHSTTHLEALCLPGLSVSVFVCERSITCELPGPTKSDLAKSGTCGLHYPPVGGGVSAAMDILWLPRTMQWL